MGKNIMPKAILVIVLLLLAAVFVGIGCLQVRSEKEDLLAVEPNVAALVVPGDYASGALAATGGVVTWTKMIQLGLDGVVTFYQPGGSGASHLRLGMPYGTGDFYLTEHHFEVYPWSNSIRISAAEPQSRFVWQLAAGQFRLLEGNEAVGNWPKVISNRDYAEAVLAIITAPVRFLDQSISFQKSATPVKIESLWYYPIEKTYLVEHPTSAGGKPPIKSAAVEPYWSKVVFFQNKDSNLIDIIWFASVERNKFFAVRGYDYKAIQKNGVLVPTKIEIFKSEAGVFFKERLVKIDFKNRKP